MPKTTSRLIEAVRWAAVAAAAIAGPARSAPPPRAFSTADYAAVLAAYVDDRGRVDYHGLQHDRAGLDRFIASLGEVPESLYEEWPTADRIAFWINAYNALNLKIVIDNYPIQARQLRSLVFPKNSIRQLPGVWQDVCFRVAGRAVTVDEIAKEILDREFYEPRVCFALVSATESAPPLRAEPYRGGDLSSQLDDQARRFVADRRNLRVDWDAGTVEISFVIEWAGPGFVAGYTPERGYAELVPPHRAVLSYLSRFVGDEDRSFLLLGKYKVVTVDYDWSLNERPTRIRPTATATATATAASGSAASDPVSAPRTTPATTTATPPTR